MNDAVIYIGALIVVGIVAMIGMWNNWIWIGDDGYLIPYERRPGFFKFWISGYWLLNKRVEAK
ncbi:hypothetical protein HY967_04900 [Candidatus Jorgensenbacteria bacterium]|nr:hypothetical protein [Candidatus Jorgensenbacteria bacterium]